MGTKVCVSWYSLKSCMAFSASVMMTRPFCKTASFIIVFFSFIAVGLLQPKSDIIPWSPLTYRRSGDFFTVCSCGFLESIRLKNYPTVSCQIGVVSLYWRFASIIFYFNSWCNSAFFLYLCNGNVSVYEVARFNSCANIVKSGHTTTINFIKSDIFIII